MPSFNNPNGFNALSNRYGGSGRFGGSQYNNPQMSAAQTGGVMPNQYTGGTWGMPAVPSVQAPQGPGWLNPNAADTQWRGGMMPEQAAWSGPAPGHHGQQYSFNPYTGEGSWENTAGGVGIGGNNPYGSGALSWIDPKTGLRTINPRAIERLMGGLGMGSSSSNFEYDPYQFTAPPTSGFNLPEKYGGFDYDTIGSGIDPGAVIAAQEYRLKEAMEGDMARAGGRLGQSGFAMSTPYANELGSAARKASQDRNALTLQYQYDAAQQQAARDLAQQLQAAQQDFGAWGQHGSWDVQGQLAQMQNAAQMWGLQNQLGLQQNMFQNELGYNQAMAGQDLQQQLMMSILGGLF